MAEEQQAVATTTATAEDEGVAALLDAEKTADLTVVEPEVLGYAAEAKDLLKLTGPIVLSSIFRNLLRTVDVLFVGRLGELELAGVALGALYCNGTATIGFGLGSTMSTLGSQAFGAKNPVAFSLATQRTIVVVVGFALLLTPLWLFAEPILVATKQEETVASLAAQYIRISLLGILPEMLGATVNMYLASQGVVKPLFYTSVLANVTNAFFNWLFIFGFGLGFTGAPIATVLTRWATLALRLAFVYFGKHTAMWTGWDKAAFSPQGLLDFLKLGVPSAVMICTEVWLFLVSAFMTGLLGPVQLAANEITFNLYNLIFTVALGISLATCIRVGNVIGAGHAQKAKMAAHTGLLLTFCTSILVAFVLAVTRHYVGFLYTDSQRVAHLVAAVIPIICVFVVFDGIMIISGGVLRGIGRQGLGSIVNVVGMWGLGLPLGGVLAFVVHLDIFGIWWGLATGLASTGVVLFVYIYCMVDWEAEVRRAAANTHKAAGGGETVGAREEGGDIEMAEAPSGQSGKESEDDRAPTEQP